MLQRIDNSALYHCAMMSEKYMNSFRLKLIFKEEIDQTLLSKVCNGMIKRFPSFFASITNDNFWYYTKALENIIIHKYDGEFQTIKYLDINKYAVALLCDDKTLVLEVFHAISDGAGALYVFKEIVKEYINLKEGKKVKYQDYLLEENIDSYNDVPLIPKVKETIKIKNPYMFNGKNFDAIPQVRAYEIDLEHFKTFSKGLSCTVNDLIVLLFYRAIRDLKNDERQISLLLPINLRKLFDSKTVKNFIITSKILLDSDEDTMIINDIKKQLKAQNNFTNLAYEVNKINRLYRSSIIKFIPLIIKCMFIKLVYHIGRKENTCITLSNLGKVEFGDYYDKHIDSLSFALSPRFNGPYNCGIVSYGNKLIIEITHDKDNYHLLNAFEKILNKYQIKYK